MKIMHLSEKKLFALVIFNPDNPKTWDGHIHKHKKNRR